MESLKKDPKSENRTEISAHKKLEEMRRNFDRAYRKLNVKSLASDELSFYKSMLSMISQQSSDINALLQERTSIVGKLASLLHDARPTSQQKEQIEAQKIELEKNEQKINNWAKMLVSGINAIRKAYKNCFADERQQSELNSIKSLAQENFKLYQSLSQEQQMVLEEECKAIVSLIHVDKYPKTAIINEEQNFNNNREKYLKITEQFLTRALIGAAEHRGKIRQSASLLGPLRDAAQCLRELFKQPLMETWQSTSFYQIVSLSEYLFNYFRDSYDSLIDSAARYQQELATYPVTNCITKKLTISVIQDWQDILKEYAEIPEILEKERALCESLFLDPKLLAFEKMESE